jgi:hypothetical protein
MIAERVKSAISRERKQKNSSERTDDKIIQNSNSKSHIEGSASKPLKGAPSSYHMNRPKKSQGAPR